MASSISLSMKSTYVKDNDQTTYMVSWSYPYQGNQTGYEIQYKRKEDRDWSTLGKVNGKSLSFDLRKIKDVIHEYFSSIYYRIVVYYTITLSDNSVEHGTLFSDVYYCMFNPGYTMTMDTKDLGDTTVYPMFDSDTFLGYRPENKVIKEIPMVNVDHPLKGKSIVTNRGGGNSRFLAQDKGSFSDSGQYGSGYIDHYQIKYNTLYAYNKDTLYNYRKDTLYAYQGNYTSYIQYYRTYGYISSYYRYGYALYSSGTGYRQTGGYNTYGTGYKQTGAYATYGNYTAHQSTGYASYVKTYTTRVYGYMSYGGGVRYGYTSTPSSYGSYQTYRNYVGHYIRYYTNTYTRYNYVNGYRATYRSYQYTYNSGTGYGNAPIVSTGRDPIYNYYYYYKQYISGYKYSSYISGYRYYQYISGYQPAHYTYYYRN